MVTSKVNIYLPFVGKHEFHQLDIYLSTKPLKDMHLGGKG